MPSTEQAAPARGSPQGHSFLQTSTCSGVGSLPWAAGGDLLHCGPPWTAGGQSASPRSSSRAAREDSLLQHLKHLLPPPSSLTLVSEELFLSHRLTSSLFTAVSPQLPLSLIRWALGSGRSVLEPAGTGFIRHGGSFSQLLTESTPTAPLLPKPCCANP